MNELSKYLVEQILLEDENPIKKIVVVYVGRFQPMHKGHHAVYEHLVKKFGKTNVFVGTSNKVDKPRSPFNFKEKVKIATTMFGIPKSKIHQVKNPYNPQEILSKFDKETTAFITVVSEKDKSRLGADKGKYFQTLKGNPSEGYGKRGYVYVVPILGQGVSGTESRNGLTTGSEEDKKKFFKDRVYGKFNPTIFKMITDKLSEGIHIPKERIEEWMINESSFVIGNGSDVDDGPSYFFPNYDVFQKVSLSRASKIGWEVISMMMGKELEDYYEHPTYPNGPTKTVSYFPAGVIGAQTPNNQIDIYSSDAYTKWYKFATRKASLVGYSLISDPSMKDDKKQSGDDARGDKELKDEFEASLNEAIKLPVEIGDTILTGRFKNKKTVVKSIGKDEHGMPTINGKKVVTFRLMKEGFIAELAGTSVKCEKCNHSWEIESEDTEKYLCHSCGWDSQQQEYDYDAFDSWQEKMGLDESIEERSGKLRPSQKLSRKRALAGKQRQIQRKRHRTMIRRKGLDKLKKIAYKMAYRQVYDEFAKDLFPDVKKSDLSIEQSKVVHRNVLRKKKRVLKRARFQFLPDLRAKEAEKFSRKDEMSKSTLNKIEKYAEKQLSPEDIEFTRHFFDRVNDPRNGKEISDAELTGFFKRLSRYKKQFKDFLEKYQQIVVKDKRSDINIPFVKQANQIIAKTVMRKDDFKTSNPVLAFEQLAKGMSLRDIADKHDVSFEELSKEAKKGVKVEMEHTSDVKQAYDIAKDHLFEDPKYYTKLATIEELAPHGYPDQEWMDNHEKEIKKLRKTLDQQQKEFYKESVIVEGGAATGGSPIPAEHSMDMYNGASKVIASTFKLKSNDIRPIGSTGKKREGDFNGDIDMIIDAAKIGANFKLKFDEVQDFIFNKLKSKFKNVVNLKGLGVVSFLYPIPNSDEFGQVDLMLTDDLELSSFMYHSPNFKENESKYKGLYRNSLLFSIVMHIPTNIPDEYFEDGKDKGKVKKFSKHSLNQKKGLMTQMKSFEGKLGALKNAKTIKGSDIHITSVPNEIVKYIFGDKHTVDEMKSFESIYKLVMSSNFKHKKNKSKIIKSFKDSILKMNLPLPSEIK